MPKGKKPQSLAEKMKQRKAMLDGEIERQSGGGKKKPAPKKSKK